jgi:hypothetical protein
MAAITTRTDHYRDPQVPKANNSSEWTECSGQWALASVHFLMTVISRKGLSRLGPVLLTTICSQYIVDVQRRLIPGTLTLEVSMLMWIVPLSVFCIVGAIVFGGGPVTIESQSVPRQLLGLLATLVVYLVVWDVLRLVLERVLPLGGAIAIASLLSIPTLPFDAALGFRAFGVRTHRGGEGHPSHS